MAPCCSLNFNSFSIPFAVQVQASRFRFRECYSSFSHPIPTLRCAVLGAGFAGLSVTWHLLQNIPKERRLQIDVIDEVGIGGGASGVSGGLLHPYSPKVKLLWRGEECWNECMSLLSVAEQAAAAAADPLFSQGDNKFIVRRCGILRPAVCEKKIDIMYQNAKNSLGVCQIQTIDEDTAKHLVPNLSIPLNAAFFMPNAVNINPQYYLQV